MLVTLKNLLKSVREVNSSIFRCASRLSLLNKGLIFVVFVRLVRMAERSKALRSGRSLLM